MESLKELAVLLEKASEICAAAEAISQPDVQRLETCLRRMLQVSEVLSKAQRISEWVKDNASILSPEALCQVMDFVKKYENVLPKPEDY